MPWTKVHREPLRFDHLPSYASFVLQNRLDEFVALSLDLSEEEKLPLVLLLSHIPREKLIEYGRAGVREMLEAIIKNESHRYIDDTVEKWKVNALKMIEKDSISTIDITVGGFIRRKIFRKFLTEFTSDTEVMKNIMEEVDRFTTRTALASYDAYMMLQQDQLARKNAELERINEELESFSYVASHDLKEPLRKIQTFSSRLLEKREGLPEGVVDYLYRINAASGRMKLLIEDMLAFSQIISPANAFEEVELSQTLEEAKQSLSLSIEKNGVQIDAVPLPRVKVIPFQFFQLFSNLIANSIKYRKENVAPRIAIRWEKAQPENAAREHYLHIIFSDNGIGFNDMYKEKIFELFKRLHPKEKYSGTGIGLAICKKIVESHGGFIRADGIEGKGADFHIYLPWDNVLQAPAI